jgi:hypothetical protein
MMIVLGANCVRVALGQYESKWHSLDGGGQTFSTGGAYSLGGTIGQHDAGPGTGPLTGGAYSLIGGFWPVTSVCACPGDMNGDGLKDARDIQRFVRCLVDGGSCSCADVDSVGGVTTLDIAVFVGDLLAGDGCQ